MWSLPQTCTSFPLSNGNTDQPPEWSRHTHPTSEDIWTRVSVTVQNHNHAKRCTVIGIGQSLVIKQSQPHQVQSSQTSRQLNFVQWESADKHYTYCTQYFSPRLHVLLDVFCTFQYGLKSLSSHLDNDQCSEKHVSTFMQSSRTKTKFCLFMRQTIFYLCAQCTCGCMLKARGMSDRQEGIRRISHHLATNV